MAKKMKDDEFKIIKSELEKIASRPTMYVSSLGEAGVLHLCKEIIDNNRDEVMKKESPGDTIYVDITDKYISTRDNGRGIPTNLLREVLETIQAGSNMTRAGGATSGENGIGSTCVLALSSYYETISYRPQEKKKLILIYKNAELVEERLEDYNDDDHGLFVKFMPSNKIMGTNKIPVEELVKWIQDFDYTLPRDVKFTYKLRGKEIQVHHKWLREFFRTSFDKDAEFCTPLTCSFNGGLTETFDEITYDRTFNVEFALVYSNPEKYKGEDIRQSWMNMIYTPQNGSHLNGVLNGYIRFITEECVKRNKKLLNEDIKKDILAHLHIVVKANCDIAHMFSAQSKHAVLHRDLGKAIEQSCYEQLKKDNSNAIAGIVEVILGNHRARIAGEQARDISKATRVKKQWTMTDKYYPPTSAKTEIPKELFLVEGDSAGGGVNGSKFPHQAILMSRGKSLNAYEGDALKTINSDSWRNLIPILGCGVGPTFDIKKLKFDKVIIMTDADVDGYHIRVEYMTFFLRFLPEIIKAGKLYIAEPPLYQLTKGKQISYVATQNEYIQECIQSIGDLKLQFIQKPDNHISVRDFVTDAFNYSDILKEISVKRSVNRYLLEHIAFGLVQYKTSENFIKNIDKWLRSIASIYKEIGFDHDTNQVTAVIDYIDQYVLIDDMLINDLSEIIRIQDRYGLIVRYESLKKNLSSQTELSHFFEEIEDMYPRITDRYKGLGSSDPEVLRQVVMDPRTRRLMRVTIEDALTYQKMGALVGKSKENVLARKEILMNFKWTQADIDS